MANIRIIMNIEGSLPLYFYNEDVISFYTKTTATNDINYPVFNAFASDATLVVKDRNLDLYDLATEGAFDSYNYPVSIEIQNQDFEWKKIAQHIVKEQPKYSYVDKTLTIELGNQLDVLDSLTYAGYEYKWQAGTLYDVFADLMDKAFGVGNMVAIVAEPIDTLPKGSIVTFNDTINISTAANVGATIPLSFISNGTNYIRLSARTVGARYQLLYYLDDINSYVPYEQGGVNTGWTNSAYKILEITKDYTFTNTVIRSWIYSNATVAIPYLDYILSQPISKTNNKTFKELLTEFSIEIPYLPQKSFRQAFSDVLKLIKCSLIIDKNGEFSLVYLGKEYGSYNDKDVRVITASAIVDNVQPTIILNNKFDNVEFEYYSRDNEYSNSVPKDMIDIANNINIIPNFPRESEFNNVKFYKKSGSSFSEANQYLLTDHSVISTNQSWVSFFYFLTADVEQYKNTSRYDSNTEIDIKYRDNLRSVYGAQEYFRYSNIVLTFEKIEEEYDAEVDIKIGPFTIWNNAKIELSNIRTYDLRSRKYTTTQIRMDNSLLNGFVQNDEYLYLALLNYDPRDPDNSKFQFNLYDSDAEATNIIKYFGNNIVNRQYLEWVVLDKATGDSHTDQLGSTTFTAYEAQALKRIQKLELRSIEVTLNGIMITITFNDAHNINDSLTKKNVLNVSYSELFQNYTDFDNIRAEYLNYYRNGLRTARLNVLGNYNYDTIAGGKNSDLFEIGDAVEIKDYDNNNLFNYIADLKYSNAATIRLPADRNLRWQVLDNEITYDGGAVFQALQVKQLPLAAGDISAWIDMVEQFGGVSVWNDGKLVFRNNMGQQWNVNGNYRTFISGRWPAADKATGDSTFTDIEVLENQPTYLYDFIGDRYVTLSPISEQIGNGTRSVVSVYQSGSGAIYYNKLNTTFQGSVRISIGSSQNYVDFNATIDADSSEVTLYEETVYVGPYVINATFKIQRNTTAQGSAIRFSMQLRSVGDAFTQASVYVTFNNVVEHYPSVDGKALKVYAIREPAISRALNPFTDGGLVKIVASDGRDMSGVAITKCEQYVESNIAKN